MPRALTVSIDPQVFARFPALSVAGFVVVDLDHAAAALSRRELENQWRRAAGALGRRGVTRGSAADVPALRQWREAHASCGLPPPLCRGGLEALVQFVLAHGGVPTSVRVASLQSAIAVTHLASIGGHDLDSLPGITLVVRPARAESDWFVPLGARPTNRPLSRDVVVYAADSTIVSWSFGHTLSRQTCLASGTRRAVFFSTALTRIQSAGAVAGLNDLRAALARHGAIAGAAEFVDARTPVAELTCGTTATADT